MPILKLSKFQQKEFSKYWFDVSKLTFGSFILKLFEPASPKFTIASMITLLFGLTLALIFVMVGLRFSQGVK